MTHHIPPELKYTATHEWIRDEGNNMVTVGITDHAQELLGDVVFVELPKLEKNVNVGDECCVVESVKAAADVYCPMQGEITEINQQLTTQPELINKDPYGNGWLYKLKIHNAKQLSELLTAEKYTKEVSEHS